MDVFFKDLELRRLGTVLHGRVLQRENKEEKKELYCDCNMLQDQAEQQVQRVNNIIT